MPSGSGLCDMRIAHLTDLHFGTITQPGLVEALLRDLHACAPALICIGGDLTQRARLREYQQALEFLRQLPAPFLVVAGNHDVHAWWHLYRRLFNPLARYQSLVSEEASPRFVCPELAVLGLNVAHGWTQKNGRVRRIQREAILPFFSEAPEGAFRVLLAHHPLTRIPGLPRPHRPARKGPETLALAREAQVDLVLSGHLHVSHVVNVGPEEAPFVLCAAGSPTTSRTRAPQKGRNAWMHIDVHPAFFEIQERVYGPEGFGPGPAWMFRRARPAPSP